LSFINCWFSVNVPLIICNPYALMFARVSSILTLPGWYL
jgi:hypothetical protein